MQISCFPNTYGRFGANAAIDLLPSTEIQWLELPIKNYGVPSFFKEEPVLTESSSPAAIFALKERIQQSGLKISSCNITSGNPLQPDVVERTLKKLTIANQFGAKYVVAGGGEISSEDDWSQLIQNMNTILNRAEELGITYCCETHPGTCQNATGMLELLERVDHPNLRINFDTGNIFFYNENVDLFEQMDLVSEFISHVHLKDTNGRFKDWHFPALGAAGYVDFAQVREFLEGINFAGPSSLELEGIQGEPELSLEETHQRVIDSVDHLKATGWTIE
ncbi:sugar phosphate isomerase/epimerase [bacterium]|nr:sugar phosphate isomerase/epimerase [Planctomicrobium sp.]MDA7503604.1 sugar phosphate isomerase/epimerase [bacterium]MDA7528155.1 sugar phosphate isomerase/epimerase [bacterium]